MKNKSYRIFALLSSFILCACAGTSNVGSLTGLYSAAHPVTTNGEKMLTDDYLYIDNTGKMTAYVSRDDGKPSDEEKCYLLARDTDTNASLQGLILSPGMSPKGEADYETQIGPDTFGILVEPSKTGTRRWFVRAGVKNSMAIVVGIRNVANIGNQSYSISFPALQSPTLADIQSRLCSR